MFEVISYVVVFILGIVVRHYLPKVNAKLKALILQRLSK